MDIEDFSSWMLCGGLGFGLAFGIVLQRSRFRLLAAVGNFVLLRDWCHLHAWLIAVAVAVAGTTALEVSGTVAIGESSFRRLPATWAGSVLGGLVFGLARPMPAVVHRGP